MLSGDTVDRIPSTTLITWKLTGILIATRAFDYRSGHVTSGQGTLTGHVTSDQGTLIAARAL